MCLADFSPVGEMHGFLRERYVDEPQFLIRFPGELRDIGHLLEPTTVIEKGITQAYEIQRRLKVWRPERALVLGAGTIGLLATMGLQLRGVDVTTAGLEEAPYLNSDLVEELGARYISTKDVSVADACRKFGPFDVIFECTGYSPIAFQAMEVLGKNGVLVLSSVTGVHRVTEVPVDLINLSFVLGNKVMVGTVNASREHFEAGVRDLALSRGGLPRPGVQPLRRRPRAKIPGGQPEAGHRQAEVPGELRAGLREPRREGRHQDVHRGVAVRVIARVRTTLRAPQPSPASGGTRSGTRRRRMTERSR